MYISRAAAQEIVEEIGEEIREHINMMDANGIIIASTNPARIGQLHEGARRIITEGLEELYISGDMETETTKMGINLPLTIGGTIAGVVGITGDRERIIGYGNIVRRMTEIMILNSMEKDAQRYDRRMRYHFIKEWISKSGTSYGNSFVERGLQMGINVKRAYRVMTIYFPDYGELSDTLDGQKLLEEMEASIRHEMEQERNPYLRESPKQICLLPLCGDEVMEEQAERLSRMIEKKYSRKIAVGFDSAQENRRNIRQSCRESEQAAKHALLWKKKWFGYDSMNIELFLGEIPDMVMQEYLKKLFSSVSEEKFGDFMHLLEYYFAYEGSIGKMADALFMHKNTLQYKLKKLADLTGKDIRLPSCAAIYYIALSFYHKLYQSGNGRSHPEG